MADFSYFKRLDVAPEATARLPLYMIVEAGVPVPTLILRPATIHNTRFHNESMRRLERRQKGGERDAFERLLRDVDRELFAQHVIVGWEDVTDAHGTPVAFASDVALEYFRAMPDSLFDQVRFFARDESNFRQVIDAASAAGNSPGASGGS